MGLTSNIKLFSISSKIKTFCNSIRTNTTTANFGFEKIKEDEKQQRGFLKFFKNYSLLNNLI